MRLIAGLLAFVLFSNFETASGSQEEVSSATLRMMVSERGEVVRLATPGDVELGGRRSTQLFRLGFTREDDFMAMKYVDSAAARKVDVKTVADGVEIVYGEFAADLPIERVVCHVRGGKDGKRIRFGLSTVTRSGWALSSADYPRLMLTRSIGASAEDDAFLSGDVFKSGSNVGKAVIRHPANPAVKEWGIHLSFPGSLTVQFAEFYDPAAGLVIAAEDAEGAPKTFHAVRTDDGFLVSWTTRVWEPGTSSRPYDVTLAAFEGTPAEPATWHDGADIYREWASQQRWCAKPIPARTDLPVWMRDAPVLTMFTHEAWFDHPQRIRDWLHHYLQKCHAGVPTVAVLCGWEHHDTWIGFDYYPCHPSDDEMKALMSEMRAAGVHPYPWPSGYFWTVLKSLYSDHVAFPGTADGKRHISREFTMPEGAAHILRVMVNCSGNARGRLGGFRLEIVESDGSVREARYEGNAHYEGFISRWIALYRGEGRAFLAHGRHVKPPFVKCAVQEEGDSAPGCLSTRGLSKRWTVRIVARWFSPMRRHAASPSPGPTVAKAMGWSLIPPALNSSLTLTGKRMD